MPPLDYTRSNYGPLSTGRRTNNPREHMARVDARNAPRAPVESIGAVQARLGSGGAAYAPARQAAVARRATANNQGNIARVPAPVAPGPVAEIAPAAPAVNTDPAAWAGRELEDEEYRNQDIAYKKALADYISNQELEKGQYKTNYETSLKDLGTRKERSLQDILEDFASRGQGQAGTRFEAQDKALADYGRQETELLNAYNQFLGGSDLARQQYESQQGIDVNAAKQAAIQRLILKATGAV